MSKDFSFTQKHYNTSVSSVSNVTKHYRCHEKKIQASNNNNYNITQFD